jgi:quinate dehydrogenase (quinone)
MPGGVIRAYDVITGQLRWAFDPRNPDPNYVLKPGETYKRSSANSWAAMSYDPQMNTVFLPMGSSSVDVWGGNRTAPDHKYNTSVLALDASTGKESGSIRQFTMIFGILTYQCSQVWLISQ